MSGSYDESMDSYRGDDNPISSPAGLAEPMAHDQNTDPALRTYVSAYRPFLSFRYEGEGYTPERFYELNRPRILRWLEPRYLAQHRNVQFPSPTPGSNEPSAALLTLQTVVRDTFSPRPVAAEIVLFMTLLDRWERLKFAYWLKHEQYEITFQFNWQFWLRELDVGAPLRRRRFFCLFIHVVDTHPLRNRPSPFDEMRDHALISFNNHGITPPAGLNDRLWPHLDFLPEDWLGNNAPELALSTDRDLQIVGDGDEYSNWRILRSGERQYQLDEDQLRRMGLEARTPSPAIDRDSDTPPPDDSFQDDFDYHRGLAQMLMGPENDWEDDSNDSPAEEDEDEYEYEYEYEDEDEDDMHESYLDTVFVAVDEDWEDYEDEEEKEGKVESTDESYSSGLPSVGSDRILPAPPHSNTNSEHDCNNMVLD